MTSVLTRWLSTEDGETDGRGGRVSAPLDRMPVSGAVAGLGAAGAGLTVLAALIGLAWIVEPAVGGSVLGPARLSALAWLLGHGANVQTGGIVVAVTPLGLTALLMLCCWYAAGWAGRRAQPTSLREIATVLAALVSSYSAVGIGLTLLASTSGAEIGLASTLPGLVSLSALAGAGGLLRAAGHGRLMHDALPFPSRAVLSGAGAGAALLIGAGVGTLGIAIFVDRASYAALTESLAPGWTAGVGLFVLSLLMLPNAALFALSVLLGPGVALGSATTVSPFGVSLGLVPGLPLTAALPDLPAVPLGALIGLVVPALCGLAVGAVVARRLDEEIRALPAAGWASLAGLMLAGGVGISQWLAGGSLGDAGLATIGASPLATAVAAAGFLVPAAALSAGFVRARSLRRP